MTLTLTIQDVENLDNGVPPRLRLERYGAVIGRSPQADWSLPDPQRYISSTHCEIDYDYRSGAYVLTDKSTNGVFLNGSSKPLAGTPHALADGDEIAIGSYRILARLEGDDVSAQPVVAPPARFDWPSEPPPPAPSHARDEPSRQAVISGTGPMSEHWTPPRVEPPPASPASYWDPPQPPLTPPSMMSSPIPETPAPPSAADVWGRLAEGNSVDWSRGGFGPQAPEPLAAVTADDRLGLGPRASDWSPPESSPQRPPPPQWDMIPSAPLLQPALARTSPASLAGGGDAWGAFLNAAGVAPTDMKSDPMVTMAGAGALLRRLVAGFIVLLEARARAKAQLGAQGTALSFEGNNPLKFARSPERAVAQLLNPAERGFMPAERAVEDAFRDLQAHQMATLIAMRGALSATLARFSPRSIRERAEMRGVLARILPAARDAELWNAYEREFEGVATGSDEAFMDVFAKEFRQAYEKAAADDMSRG